LDFFVVVLLLLLLLLQLLFNFIQRDVEYSCCSLLFLILHLPLYRESRGGEEEEGGVAKG
jgi:hypothetical protein